MLDRLRTLVIVSAVAVALWLYAEAESLGQFKGITTLRFVAPDTLDRMIRPASEFSGTLSVDLVGSKAAIAEAEAQLARGVRLTPGVAGVPSADGRHSVDLLATLQQYPALARSGVRIMSVSPQLVDVEVIELVELSAIVEPALGTVEVIGATRITPERATVRLPKSAANGNTEPFRVRAELSDSQMRRLPASGTAREEARLEAAPAFAALPGFEITPSTAMLEFTIRNRTAREEFKSVPVQIVLPPIEVGRWKVEVEAEDRFVPAEVTGPADQIEKLKSSADALIAIVALSSDDLAARVATKEVSFAVLRGGVVAARSELVITSGKPTIRLKIEPMALPAPPNGAGP